MKTLALFALAALATVFSATAQPTETWTHIAESNSARFAVATTKDAVVLNPSKQMMEMWIKVEFDKVQPNGVAYQIGLQQVDFAKEQFAFREIIGYSKDGKELYHRIFRDEELKWRRASVGTVGKELFNLAEYLFGALAKEQTEIFN
jgi:hypothetical protein